MKYLGLFIALWGCETKEAAPCGEGFERSGELCVPRENGEPTTDSAAPEPDDDPTEPGDTADTDTPPGDTGETPTRTRPRTRPLRGQRDR
jgi:hypothetical protein